MGWRELTHRSQLQSKKIPFLLLLLLLLPQHWITFLASYLYMTQFSQVTQTPGVKPKRHVCLITTTARVNVNMPSRKPRGRRKLEEDRYISIRIERKKKQRSKEAKNKCSLRGTSHPRQTGYTEIGKNKGKNVYNRAECSKQTHHNSHSGTKRRAL